MSTSAHRFPVGEFECFVIQDKEQKLPVSFLLSDGPKDELERVARQHNINPDSIDFSINILVVKIGSHVILVDTGQADESLPDKLKAIGVDAAAIDRIIVTHGHGDHVNGIVDSAGNFTYPNAR